MDGINEWINDLLGIQQRTPVELKKFVNRTSNKLFAKTVRRTPVRKKNGGTLRRNWQNKGISEFERQIVNNTEYGPDVEFGHRVVRDGDTVGYVEGRYMLKRSIEEVEDEIEGELSIALDNILR